MKKVTSRLKHLKLFPQTPLELLVRQGRLDVVEQCRKRCLELAEPSFALTEPLMLTRQAAGMTLASLCNEAAAHLEELRDLLEMEFGVEPDGVSTVKKLDLVPQQPTADFVSDVAKLLGNMGDLLLVFRLLDCVAQVPGRVSDLLGAATVLMYVKHSALLAVRYLVFAPARSPAEDVVKLLRVVRLLAMAGRIRSAFATASMVMKLTRGAFRRDAADAVMAIKRSYLKIAIPKPQH
jgi:hypothetical protein